MITNLENTAVQLSATKKDFYQIWNEILELAGKISERWDPTSTNESDPGIVLLKVLTAVADKLNYTVDANILEAFMPSAAQEESMRKLTEMLGYNMKYYQSATTKVKITYNASGNDPIDTNVVIDRFTNLKDRDDTINYVTLSPISLNIGKTSAEVECIEGELVECETDDDNIISILQLDDNNRYFLPETQVAENGIFVTNVSDDQEGNDWTLVDNLNTQNVGTKCFKFGFDSREGLPYIQFPEDIATIIEDGLKIKYIRTNGINGNISLNTLVRMEDPKNWGDVTSNTDTNDQNTKGYYNVDNYTVSNLFAANNGRDKESLNDAYNNYKKTIGTFDTLVTCRDYMNKIYQMTFEGADTTNLVSNVIVSDIRDDINKAFTLCTFNEHGIAYVNKAKHIDLKDAELITAGEYDALTPPELQYAFEHNIIYKVVEDTDISKFKFFAKIIWNGLDFEPIEINTNEITHFDLILYPFKNVYGLNSKAEYTKSFKYDNSNLVEIKQELEKNKTMSHNFVAPDGNELACIKNYLKLNAKITTVKKVNAIEQASILTNVFSSLYANFNMRKVDFGEEIPYDSILSVMENADSRIKNVSLEEPTLLTKFCTVGGSEYTTSTKITSEDPDFLGQAGDQYFNQLVLNNVLAGRIPLFKYNEDFKPEYTESKYGAGTDPESGIPTDYDLVYPTSKEHCIYKLKPEFEINDGTKDYKLQENEVVQFRLPNLKTETTYPAYVNYYIHLNTTDDRDVPIVPAIMQNLETFILKNNIPANESEEPSAAAAWNNLLNTSAGGIGTSILDAEQNVTADNFSKLLEAKRALYYLDNTTYKYTSTFVSGHSTYYFPTVKETNFGLWANWIKAMVPNIKTDDGSDSDSDDDITINNHYDIWAKIGGIYIQKGQDINANCGKLVDINHIKYKQVSKYYNTASPLTYYYVPVTFEDNNLDDDNLEDRHTKDGLGQNGKYSGIPAKSEYCLQPHEYLLINYTSSKTVDDEETKTIINKCYRAGTIIKPNFELIDSESYRDSHSYSKTSGYDFSEFLDEDVQQPEGMFSLGVNEQIEVRDFARVYLDEMSSNIYWELQDEVPNSIGRVDFKWDEDPVDEDGNPTTEALAYKFLSHTLKEGEYFYYTNKDKTDIAYYGAGTKITQSFDTPLIFKYIKDTTVSTDEIMTYGLSASIPWRPYDFSKSNGLVKRLAITEYKYINLIKDNILNTVSITDRANATCIDTNLNSYSWTPITGATYTIDDQTLQLDYVNFGANSGISWEARSSLDLDVGPNTTQTLHTTFMLDDNKNQVVSTIDKLTLIGQTSAKTDETIKVLKALSDTAPLSFKANKVLQGSFVNLDVTTKDYTEDGRLLRVIPDFAIKLFNTDNVVDNENNTINLGNFGDGNFTKLSFEEASDPDAAYATLNVIVPEDNFGLIMFYNTKIGTGTKNIGLRLLKPYIEAEVDPNDEGLKIFNYHGEDSSDDSSDDEDVWWVNDPETGGKIDTVPTWAVEAKPFSTLTETEFNNRSTGLYKRTSAEVRPAYETLKRWDNFTHTWYKYTKVTIPFTFNAKAEYGVLTADGSSSSDAVENSTYPFNTSRTEDNIRSLINDNENVCIREAGTWTPTPEAYKRFDYITYILYTYTAVNTGDIYNDKAYYGYLLDDGGTSIIYRLRNGINIVRIDNSCKLEIYPDADQKDTLVFGNLDIINDLNTDPEKNITFLNPKLCYKKIDKGTAEDQILADINKIDVNHDFYYNAIIDNASSIDLNENDNEDTLENPLTWYNYNNINNKFVISEIDADALKDNVVIAKSSRLS